MKIDDNSCGLLSSMARGGCRTDERQFLALIRYGIEKDSGLTIEKYANEVRRPSLDRATRSGAGRRSIGG